MRLRSITKQIRRKGSALGKPTIEVDIGADGKNTWAEDVLQQINKHKACTRVVFKGLDPLVDQLDILSVIDRLQDGWETIIETTGGIMPDFNLRERVNMWEINIPSDEKEVPFIYNEDAIRFFSTQKNSFFEWEIRGENDLLDVKKKVFLFNLPWKQVILSLNTEWSESIKDIKSQLDWLETFCLEKGCIIGNPIIKNKE